MKWALILGASGDIGSQIAKDLAAQGWSLYLHYHRNKTKMLEICSQLQKQYPKQDFLLLSADMTQADSAQKIAKQLFGLDALIFAQGTTKYGLLRDLTRKDLEELTQMHLTCPLELIGLLEEKLASSQAGRIVFIGSVYGVAGSALEVGYSTLKGALSAFVKAYSQEVASLAITVNVVAPGAVDTQMNQTFSKQERQEISEQIPLGRFATPTEISYWVCSLLPKQAAYMTGQTLYISGGWLN